MSVNTSTITTQKHYPPQVLDDEEICYSSTIPNYMPENNIHFVLIANLAVILQAFLERKNGNYVFGDIMFYYEKGNRRKFVAPDLMICLGKRKEPSKGVYKLWEEQHVPQVVVEIASESTWREDLSRKYALYQQLGVKEYYIFDVEYKCLKQPLLAYNLIDGEFAEAEVKNGRVFSKALGLELVDTGETLRLFNPETNEFLLTIQELAAKERIAQNKIAQLEIEIAELRKQND